MSAEEVVLSKSAHNAEGGSSDDEAAAPEADAAGTERIYISENAGPPEHATSAAAVDSASADATVVDEVLHSPHVPQDNFEDAGTPGRNEQEAAPAVVPEEEALEAAEEEEAAGDMDDPFAMMIGMGEEEVYKVTLMEETAAEAAEVTITEEPVLSLAPEAGQEGDFRETPVAFWTALYEDFPALRSNGTRNGSAEPPEGAEENIEPADPAVIVDPTAVPEPGEAVEENTELADSVPEGAQENIDPADLAVEDGNEGDAANEDGEQQPSGSGDVDEIDLLDKDPDTFRIHKQAVARAILRSILLRLSSSTDDDDEVEEFDTFRAPRLEPMEAVVWLELKKNELVVNEAAMDVFKGESRFVNAIMISGKLRTGKSYLMNALSDSQAFGVSGQARSFTQGVHICNRLVSCSQFGGPEEGPRLAFVDAEGQADKGKSYDIKLATPLLLVSKVIIMNEICPTGPSKEDILRTIEIFMRAAEQVSERKKRKGLFGNLHLMMRDCAQDEQECWDIIFEQEDPNASETDGQAKAIDERNKIREGIFNAFESVPKVWCLPKLAQSHAPSNYRECDRLYVDKIHEIRAFMALQLAAPKLIDEKPLTGTMIAALMPQLQEALKVDSPILNPPSMMQAVCDLEAERIGQTMSDEAERLFRIDIARKLPLPSPHYEGEIDCAKALLSKQFMEKIAHLPAESQEKVFPPFEQRLNLMDERLAALNREKLADRATQQAVDRANSLQDQMEAERRRADDARSEIDNLLASREHEKNRADMLLAQIEASNSERQGERDRIAELEELLNKEVGEREADLQKQVADEQRKLQEAEQALKDEEERQKLDKEEQERLYEEQRLEMEELQAKMDEERAAREEAEKELGLRAEDIAREDEAAQLLERAAEAKKEIPLILAVKDKDLLAVRGLVRRHPDSLHLKDKNQRTALHFAEDKLIAEALVKGRGDPNAQDMGFWTPLHVSVSRGSFEVAECFMKANGNVLLTTRHGNTALDLAYDKPDMTVMLLSQLPELYNTLELDKATAEAPAPAAQSIEDGAAGAGEAEDEEADDVQADYAPKPAAGIEADDGVQVVEEGAPALEEEPPSAQEEEAPPQFEDEEDDDDEVEIQEEDEEQPPLPQKQ